jgi:hypothetical protein
MQITLYTSAFFWVKFRQNVKIENKKEIFYYNIPIFTEKICKFWEIKKKSLDLNSIFSLVAVF